MIKVLLVSLSICLLIQEKIDGVIGKGNPVFVTTVSVEIDLAREIYERLLSQGWRRTKLFEN